MQEEKKIESSCNSKQSTYAQINNTSVKLFFFFFLVGFRSPSQSGVVPTAPLLCSETLGGKVPGSS